MSGEPANTGTERVQQAGQAAKDEASATAGHAKEAAGEVAGTAAQQARAVTDEAKQQAGAAVHDLKGRIADEAEGQADRMAHTLRQWSDDLAGLARNAPDDSPARSLVSQAADGGHRAADYLDRQGVSGLVGDLQGFARRRPGAFLGGAVLAGVVVGRLVKAGSGSNGRATTSGGASYDGARDAGRGTGAERPLATGGRGSPEDGQALPRGSDHPELLGYPER
ncbi:hypothetical protein [Streptomyces buecherae]|uniref:hypothetical protein n=1 Tax=Streptomyces buecherae TaxID=2763006 RepID=UPI00364923F4